MTEKTLRVAAILAASAALSFVLVNVDFSFLEAKLYDFRMAFGPQPKPDSRIVLVTIDERTARELNEFSPLPLDLHVQLMEELEKRAPRAVGYLVNMQRVNELNPDFFQQDVGYRFVSAVSRMQSKGTEVLLGTPFDVTGEVLPPYPLSSLPHSIALIHKDGNVFGHDNVSRRALLYLDEQPVFHMDLAQKLGLTNPSRLPLGTFSVPEVHGTYFQFRYHGNPQDSYTRISAIDLLENGKVAADALKGKIVLVGTADHTDSSDFALTPYSKALFTQSKLVIHANILDSIINRHSIIAAPHWLNVVLTLAATVFVLGWVFRSSPMYGVFATFSLGLLFSIASHLLYRWKGIWIREAQPLVGVFLTYYLVVPYRLLLEYRKRWEYQKRNEILIQVEELKSNFLNLVTHDLKTPVARIQGLAEVLLRKSSDRLIDRDKETLNSIIASTDDLNRFISSILELSKVESNNLRMKMESKDINTLIEKCLEEFKALAKARGIRLVSKLEPMFPIKLDPTLISKVLNNVIDNAIKYSPSESEVTIETREAGDWVEILVRDQGIGMTNQEIGQLFTRFYRAKNDRTAEIPGTGLGLYLTRFFIQAHQGEVIVSSKTGTGSTFTIRLPITQSGVGLKTDLPIDSKEREALYV